MVAEILLIVLIIVGVVGRVNTLSVAASLLLALRMLHLGKYFAMVERRSLELGLLFLMISILVPLAAGKVSTREMMASIFSVAGLSTVVGGIVATVINARGLSLLQNDPSLLMSVVLGAVIGIVVFRGVPIGPLMATSIAACFLWVIDQFRS